MYCVQEGAVTDDGWVEPEVGDTAPRRSHCTETFTLHRDVHTGYEQRGSNEDLVWRWRRALGDGSESACTATYALIYTLSPVAVSWAVYTVSKSV